jgi:NosR/NirI family nitrous oxide reductase transcriptional regulator
MERTLRSLAIRLFGALLLLCAAAVNAPCDAADSRLTEFISQVPAAELVPGADHYGPAQGNPPVVKAFAGERLAGYAFVNAD